MIPRPLDPQSSALPLSYIHHEINTIIARRSLDMNSGRNLFGECDDQGSHDEDQDNNQSRDEADRGQTIFPGRSQKPAIPPHNNYMKQD